MDIELEKLKKLEHALHNAIDIRYFQWAMTLSWGLSRGPSSPSLISKAYLGRLERPFLVRFLFAMP